MVSLVGVSFFGQMSYTVGCITINHTRELGRAYAFCFVATEVTGVRNQPMADAKKEEGLKIRIRLKAYDHKVIDQSAKQIVDTAIRTGATVAGPVPLPTRRSTYTVVKSPHVYKMGGEAFEMRVHKRLIDITDATPKTIDSLQNLSLPSGVDAEIRM